MGDILQRNSRGWPLHCVAWSHKYRNAFTGKIEEKVGFEYFHAQSGAHARALFYGANAQKASYGRLSVVSSAPVVGFHALDDNADEITV